MHLGESFFTNYFLIFFGGAHSCKLQLQEVSTHKVCSPYCGHFQLQRLMLAVGLDWELLATVINHEAECHLQVQKWR